MTRARELGKLANTNTLTADNTNNFVGIASTQPTTRLDVVGVVSATSFSGNGANLTGVTATDVGTLGNLNVTGIGTFGGNVTIGGTLTYEDVTNVDSVGIITAKAGLNVIGGGATVTGVSTFFSDVSIADKIIHTGDTNTAIRFPAADTFTVETGGSERLRITSGGNVGVGDDSPDVPFNVKAGGASFAGQTTHAKIEDTTSLAANVGGLLALEGVYNGSGNPAAFAMIHGGKENATDGNYQGYFRILTRPDGGLPAERLRVTSTGLVGVGTASGSSSSTSLVVYEASGNGQTIEVKAANTGGAGSQPGIRFTAPNNDNIGSVYGDVNSDSLQFSTGATERLRITSGGGFHFTNGELIENVKITAGKLSDNTNIDLENGMVHHFTTTETTTSTPNIRVNSSTSLNSVMAIGDTIAVTLITTAAAAGYSAQLTIDGSAVTEKWNGGSAPSAGGSSGNDVITYQIIKTADATYTVLGNVSNYA